MAASNTFIAIKCFPGHTCRKAKVKSVFSKGHRLFRGASAVGLFLPQGFQ